MGRWTLGLALPCYLFLILRADLCLAILGPQFIPGSFYIAVLSLGPLLVAGLEVLPKRCCQWAATPPHAGQHPGRVQPEPFSRSGAGASVRGPGHGLDHHRHVAGVSTGNGRGSVFTVRFFPVSPRVLSVTLAAVPAALYLFWMRRAPLAGSIPLELALEVAIFSLVYLACLFGLAVNREDRLVLARMIRRIRDHLGELRLPVVAQIPLSRGLRLPLIDAINGMRAGQSGRSRHRETGYSGWLSSRPVTSRSVAPSRMSAMVMAFISAWTMRLSRCHTCRAEQ